MTYEEFERELDIVIRNTFEHYRSALPRSFYAGIRPTNKVAKTTNNLRMNAYKLEKTSDGYRIFIDDSIAPYAKWINNDIKYITHGYFEDIAKDIANHIAKYFNGKVE